MKEVLFYKKLVKEIVQCQTCSHYCRIEPEKRGKCGVKKNISGKLYNLVYGKIAALNIDPIEKKPLFHFLPGTDSLSLATVGCNFSCFACQNYSLSQRVKTSGKIEGEEMSPEKIISLALLYKCPSISYTYTEPTIFLEYALAIMKLAKKKGIRNVWVSNGFITKEALDCIIPYLDAINIDLKGFSDEFYKKYCDGRLKPALETLIYLKKRGVWLEITTLTIPNFIDEKILNLIAKFIKKELGKETPWHISRFFPEISWRLRHFYATPLELVEKGCDIGIGQGLLYVYGGNVTGLASEDTYCPKCHKKMIDRTGYSIVRFDKEGKCSNCGANLNLIG